MIRSIWVRTAVLATVAASLGLAACGSDNDSDSGGAGAATTLDEAGGDYVIGVSNTLVGNGWREEMICAVKAQALASGKVKKVIVANRNGGATEQIADMKDLISQGVNAIVVNPSDRDKLNDVIAEAKSKDIAVVAVDQAVSAPDAFIATNDQVAYGKLGAEWLFKAIGGKGNVLYMRGIDGVPADTDRDTGFKEALKAYPDIKVDEVFTGWDFSKGGQAAIDKLSNNTYAGVWTSGIDYTVVNAFDTVKKTPVPVVGADNNAFIKQLIDGKPGAVVTNPAVIGGVGTAIAIDALDGKNPPKQTLLKPEVWDKATNEAALKDNYFADRDATFSSAVSVKPYTTYTPEQLFACKGPGE
jgi:ribose transport system substrate-binding protein